jgi:hypothetical protein
MKIPIVSFNVEEIAYFISFFETHISEYGLHELTNGNCGDIPSIVASHPLSMEYGNILSSQANGESNYTSILPAIGVELLNDSESPQQFMGSANQNIEITQDYISAINNIELKNRFKSGYALTKTNLTNLQTAKTQKGNEKLWGKKNSYLQDTQIGISIWDTNPQITRILYIIVRDLLKRIKHEISLLGIKNTKIDGIGSLYNFEFDKTWFGAEFTINFKNQHHQIIVDDSVVTIKSVEESVFSSSSDSRVTPVGIGK